MQFTTLLTVILNLITHMKINKLVQLMADRQKGMLHVHVTLAKTGNC